MILNTEPYSFETRKDDLDKHCLNKLNKTNNSVILIIGISGSGKTTLGSELKYKFENDNIPFMFIDSDRIL
jgi:adenylylsulfate kinase-like enzyme